MRRRADSIWVSIRSADATLRHQLFLFRCIIAAEGLRRPPGQPAADDHGGGMGAGGDCGAVADARRRMRFAYLTMLLSGASDSLATLAATASRIKNVALLVGLALFLGAVMAWFNQRRAAAKALPHGVRLNLRRSTVLDPPGLFACIFRRLSGMGHLPENRLFSRLSGPCTRSSAPAENNIKWPRIPS